MTGPRERVEIVTLAQHGGPWTASIAPGPLFALRRWREAFCPVAGSGEELFNFVCSPVRMPRMKGKASADAAFPRKFVRQEKMSICALSNMIARSSETLCSWNAVDQPPRRNSATICARSLTSLR